MYLREAISEGLMRATSPHCEGNLPLKGYLFICCLKTICFTGEGSSTQCNTPQAVSSVFSRQGQCQSNFNDKLFWLKLDSKASSIFFAGVAVWRKSLRVWQSNRVVNNVFQKLHRENEGERDEGERGRERLCAFITNSGRRIGSWALWSLLT